MSARTGEQPAGGALGAALGSALLFAGLAVPPVGGLLAVVSPLPLLLLRLRSGLLPAVLSALLAAIVVGAAFGPLRALAFLLTLVCPALLIGEAVARGRGLVNGCGWAAALMSLQLLVVLAFAGPRLGSEFLQSFEALRSPAFVETLRSRGWTAEDVDTWVQTSNRAQEALAVVFPAVFLIGGGFVVLANAFLLRAWLAWRSPGRLEGGELESLRLPFGLTVVFVLTGLCALWPRLRPVGLNLLLPVAFLFLLQGIAVVAFYLHRLPGPTLLRLALAVLVLLNPWALNLLVLLGLFDNWFDFRRFAAPKGEGQSGASPD